MNERIRPLLTLTLVGAICLAACSPTATPTPVPMPTATPVTSALPSTTLVPPQPIGGVDVAWEKVVQPPEDVVAVVNGKPISKQAYLDKLRRQLTSVTESYGLDWYDEDTASYLPTFQDQVLQLLINEELARQLAAAEGIVIDAAARQAELDRAKESVLQGGQYGSWEEFLIAYGSTQEELEDEIDQYLVYQGLLQAHGGPTDAEQVHALHILVETEEAGKQVLDKLASGSTFADLAQEFSIDTGSAAEGGDIGWFPRGAMVPEFEDVAFALEPGETSGLVQSQFGYHIIRMLEKAVRPLDAMFLEEQQQAALQTWFSEQLDVASVQTLVQFGAPTP